MDRPILANIAKIRRQEMDAARRILGIKQEWLGFVDSGFPEGDPPPPLPDACFALQPVVKAVQPLVAAIRAFRPHVVTTYDENGGYPHPDHVMCHIVSVAAFDAAADETAYPRAGEPWQASKLYYHHSFHRERTQALHDEMLRRGLESRRAARGMEARPRARAAHHDEGSVRCVLPGAGPRVARARNADRPGGAMVRVPLDVHQAAWPTEDYELARCLVDTELPEDDLFAGLR